MRKAFSATGQVLSAIGGWIQETVDTRDVVLATGLVLLSVGLWKVWPPAALIVPGAIITSVAIFAGRIDGNAREG
jgi:hypothetical protein